MCCLPLPLEHLPAKHQWFSVVDLQVYDTQSLTRTHAHCVPTCPPGNLPSYGKVLVWPYRALLWRQVTHMPVAGQHLRHVQQCSHRWIPYAKEYKPAQQGCSRLMQRPLRYQPYELRCPATRCVLQIWNLKCRSACESLQYTSEESTPWTAVEASSRASFCACDCRVTVHASLPAKGMHMPLSKIMAHAHRNHI